MRARRVRSGGNLRRAGGDGDHEPALVPPATSGVVVLVDAVCGTTSSVASRRSLVLAEVRDLCCLALLCLLGLVMATKERGREFAAGCGEALVRTVGIFR